MANIIRESQNISLRVPKKNKFQIFKHYRWIKSRKSKHAEYWSRKSKHADFWSRKSKHIYAVSKKNKFQIFKHCRSIIRESQNMPNIGRESQNMPNFGRESRTISLRCQKKKFSNFETLLVDKVEKVKTCRILVEKVKTCRFLVEKVKTYHCGVKKKQISNF